jgi:hypothetical protein
LNWTLPEYGVIEPNPIHQEHRTLTGESTEEWRSLPMTSLLNLNARERLHDLRQGSVNLKVRGIKLNMALRKRW